MSFFGTRRQAEPTPPPSQPERSEPPKPSVPPSPVGFETLLGASSTMEGILRSSANVRLDGTFKGTLEITGNILVGETAKIEADINAKNISVAGAVRGNISGKKVQLLRTGRVWGDIQATALTTEEGAFIDGKITMVSHEAAAPVVEPPIEAAPPEAEISEPEPSVSASSAPIMDIEPETAVSELPENPPAANPFALKDETDEPEAPEER
ncbi:MAG TPA: polymer-forming cytoskeletal protein [Phototrophicaceae bacterium]|nr:polymer-forming cytoskeletal protein [Phototrophicaceae bacterium]